MRQDAWRGYLELALGLTDASRKQATKAVKRALGKGGATAEQLQGLADELLKTSAANREAVTALVRAELDRAMSRLGLAKADEVTELNARVRELEAELRAARAGAGPASRGAAVEVALDPDLETTPRVVPAEPFGAGAAEPAAPVAPAKVAKKTAKKAVRTPDVPAEPGDALTATLDAAATGPTKTAPASTVGKIAPAKKAPAKKVAKKVAPAKRSVPATANAGVPAGSGSPAKKAPARKVAKKATGGGRS